MIFKETPLPGAYVVELTAENRKALYIPEGFAHGFQTTKDDTEVFYQMSECYYPESARGVRYNDSAFAIEWPVVKSIVSRTDKAINDYAPSV